MTAWPELKEALRQPVTVIAKAILAEAGIRDNDFSKTARDARGALTQLTNGLVDGGIVFVGQIYLRSNGLTFHDAVGGRSVAKIISYLEGQGLAGPKDSNSFFRTEFSLSESTPRRPKGAWIDVHKYIGHVEQFFASGDYATSCKKFDRFLESNKDIFVQLSQGLYMAPAIPPKAVSLPENSWMFDGLKPELKKLGAQFLSASLTPQDQAKIQRIVERAVQAKLDKADGPS